MSKFDKDELHLLIDFLEEVIEEAECFDATEEYLSKLERTKQIIKILIKE